MRHCLMIQPTIEYLTTRELVELLRIKERKVCELAAIPFVDENVFGTKVPPRLSR